MILCGRFNWIKSSTFFPTHLPYLKSMYVNVVVYACVSVVLYRKRRTIYVTVSVEKNKHFIWIFSACKQTNKQSGRKKRLYDAFDFILFGLFFFALAFHLTLIPVNDLFLRRCLATNINVCILISHLSSVSTPTEPNGADVPIWCMLLHYFRVFAIRRFQANSVTQNQIPSSSIISAICVPLFSH